RRGPRGPAHRGERAARAPPRARALPLHALPRRPRRLPPVGHAPAGPDRDDRRRRPRAVRPRLELRRGLLRRLPRPPPPPPPPPVARRLLRPCAGAPPGRGRAARARPPRPLRPGLLLRRALPALLRGGPAPASRGGAPPRERAAPGLARFGPAQKSARPTCAT